MKTVKEKLQLRLLRCRIKTNLNMFFNLRWISSQKTSVSSFYKVIIHLNKLLGSDWLKRSAFLVNTVQKRVTQCKKVKHECKLQRRYPKLKRRLPEANRRISKNAEDRPKPSEDFRKPYEAFRRLPKTTRNLPKISEDRSNISECSRRSPEYFRTLPKITRTLPKFSEDRPNISEDLRQSPEISEDHRIFSKLFQVLDDRTQYLLCTSVVNVWSEALSCPFFQVYY